MQRISHTKLSFNVAFFCVFFLTSKVFSQTIPLQGSPFIKHYSYKDYGGTHQVWCTLQDKRGVMYFGDNGGILEFDGSTWRQIQTPKRTCVRSMCSDSIGTIYIGSINEFGFLTPNNVGEMQYISLSDSLPESERNFQNVWKTHCTSEGVYFVSPKFVFRYSNKKLTTIDVNLTTWFAENINDGLYLIDAQRGMCFLQDTVVVPLPGLIDKNFRSAIPYPDNRILLANSKSEWLLYNVSSKTSENFDTDAREYLIAHQIYFISRIDESRFAAVTKTGGIAIFSNSGKLVQIVNEKSGLSAGMIVSLFTDNDQNIWACTDKGIVKIDINYPAEKFNSLRNINHPVLSSCLVNNKRYAGTLNGLFYLPAPEKARDYTPEFIPINSHPLSCWALYPYRDMVLGAGMFELFAIQDTIKKSLLKFTGLTAYFLAENEKFPDVLFFSVSNELRYVRFNQNPNFRNIKVVEEYTFPEIKDRIVRITPDKDGNLWANSGTEGIYFIRFTGDDIKNYTVTLLGKKNGLSKVEETYSYNIDNEIYIATKEGILRPEFPAGNAPDSLIRFNYSTIFGDLIKDEVSQIVKTSTDKYLIRGNSMYYATKTGQGIAFDSSGFNRITSADEIHLVIKNEDNSLCIGGGENFFVYSSNSNRYFKSPFQSIIRKVIIHDDSVLFNGTFYEINDSAKTLSCNQTPEFIPAINYHYNSITLHYAGLFYEEPQLTQFQHQLVGFDKKWSGWSTDNKTVYTNLREGKYTFRVKALNVYGAQSNVAEYCFVITAPWYRTWWAICLYTLVSGLIIFTAFKFYTKRLRRQKEYLELIVEERTGEIIEQARELKTINEKLVEMDKFKQGVTSMIVHDLKNPINAIINTTKSNPETQLERIIQTGRQMLNLVMNILDVSKFEETKIPLTIENHNLLNVSQRAIGQVLFLSNEKNITILNHINPELGIRADAEMVERVFANILTNAIKYTSNNGSIVIHVESKDDFLRISITDNGIGIPSDKLQHVFQKFGQVVAKNSGSVRSTGLGLTYCKMVIEAHGGSIGVESEQEKGSTFWFTLPAKTAIYVSNQLFQKAETIKHVQLSEANRALLNEQLNELRRIEFYKVSEIIAILDQIDESNDEDIRAWKQALISAVETGNERLFRAFTN
ncbi:MAG TPA: ATP-binding protein [Prolixibacteraceae bacterium]|nr:ATP-binding protein [Prolixibacteraceae bacterium]